MVIRAPAIDITFENLTTLIAGASIQWISPPRDESNTREIAVSLTNGLTLSFRSRQWVEVIDYGDDLRTYPVCLIEDNRRDQLGSLLPLNAVEIEGRIHATRQIHALVLLLQTDRIDKLSAFLDADLEQALENEEKLYFSSVSTGSLWAALTGLRGTSVTAALTVAGMFFSEARDALLRTLRARAQSLEFDVLQKEMDLRFSNVERAIDILQRIEKIKDSELRDRVLKSFGSSLAVFGKSIADLPKEES